MTINKEIELPKFPLFNPGNPQKFFEGCLQTYRRYWSEVLIIQNPKGKISHVQNDFKKRDEQNVKRVLEETDHREVASIIGSYARLITKAVYSFRFVTNCWCCVGARDDRWHCDVKRWDEGKETNCPANFYCCPSIQWLNSCSESLGFSINIKSNLAKNIVLTQCRRHGFSQVWRWLPGVDEAQQTEKQFKRDSLEQIKLNPGIYIGLKV